MLFSSKRRFSVVLTAGHTFTNAQNFSNRHFLIGKEKTCLPFAIAIVGWSWLQTKSNLAGSSAFRKTRERKVAGGASEPTHPMGGFALGERKFEQVIRDHK